MTELTAPTVVENIEDTILFMAEPFARVIKQGDLEVSLYIAGFHLEAEVRRTDPVEPTELVIRERITIQGTVTDWVKDLLDRAQKGSS